MMKKEQEENEGYWQNELRSLGIEPKEKNNLNDNNELEALADNIKQTYYQDYKAAYGDGDDDNDVDDLVDDRRFDYII